ncbi:RNA-directed DNA polymerase, eukaryota [Tanacetum coccineum]
MACSLPHTDSEVEALVQKLIDEDKGRQKAIMDLALQFENSCTAKDDLRNAYEKCNDISQESRALIDSFLKESSDKDYKLNLSIPLSPNMLGDLNVTLKDLSCTIHGTIHRKVIGDGGYKNDITVGAAMILANVSVFTPKPSQHYLNITKRNVIEVFRKDTVPGSGSG